MSDPSQSSATNAVDYSNGAMMRITWAFVALIWLMTGCDKSAQQEPPKQEPAVKVAQPLVQDVTEWDEFTRGRIEARAFGGDSRPCRAVIWKKSISLPARKSKKAICCLSIDPKPFKAMLERCHRPNWNRRKSGWRWRKTI
jgi:membrane fusion protein, multidrug efflux system